MVRALLIFGLLYWSLIAYPQERKVGGLVTYNNERQSSAVIKNQNSKGQTISSDVGEFFILAKTGDTLITGKEGYENDTLAITGEAYFAVRLEKSPLLLNEVVIRGTLPIPEKTLAESKEAYKEIYRIGDNSNIIGPDNIDKIWSAISKEGKDARKLQRTFTSGYKNSIIDRRFNKSLVSKITGYKGELLFNFMSKYRPTYEIAKSISDYDLIGYIKEKLSLNKKTK